MVATCSRTDAIIRIFDIKSKQRKPVATFDLRKATFNNDSNPPSFTSICSTPAPVNTAVPATQQLIVGTTMGRMMAVDIRFKPEGVKHSGRAPPVFRGFGGSIRDVKLVPVAGITGNNVNKVVSCSLDRFVRIHTFCEGAMKRRQLDAKFYVKTKPTCLQPVLSSYLIADMTEELSHIDDSDFESEEEM
jgi:hypothetical protein